MKSFLVNGKTLLRFYFIKRVRDIYYRQISLLPVSGRIFETLLFDRIFVFLTENNWISDIQSDFKPDYLCINQLLSTTRRIYQSFADNLVVRAIFVDISTVFDNVYRKYLTYRLKQNSISGKILNITINFLSFRK